ncbi:hypothetical protein LTR37_002585 [Vermiconidia calcicola]|uniref:Uncharacterized protein n=1 Tax=Vermiconidia calcicola TaxID=1690605 RepID=A0ACC3NT18_9PEZI|nr:hypothetical protein LTR37_002585 [Vermiconidia calcicola]
MRILAAVPAVLCAVALILSFLCLFAGSKKNFMEDYAIVTLNTSRIGQNLEIFDDLDLRRRSFDPLSTGEDVVNSAEEAVGNVEPQDRVKATTTTGTFDHFTAEAGGAAKSATAKAGSIYSEATGAAGSALSKAEQFSDETTTWLKKEGKEITDEIEAGVEKLQDKVEDAIKNALHSFAEILGVHDFYSAHVMDFCEGFYVPGALPNATLDRDSIHKNVTGCSNMTAMYHFDPANEISKELNESTNGVIDLSRIEWPEDLEDALNALKLAANVMFVLYCLGIAFIFLALVGSMAGLFFEGRASAAINVLIGLLAFLSIMIASSLITFIATHATKFINKYGEDIGISATRGNKFLALTWASTALVFVAMVAWIGLFFYGRRREKGVKRTQEKYEMAEYER